MLYRPNFCCHCGEKVVRNKWQFWTSRKFCVDCENDHRGNEWWGRIIAGIAVLVGVFGLGSYLKGPDIATTRKITPTLLAPANKDQVVSPNDNAALDKADEPANASVVKTPGAKKVNPLFDGDYICGARTKQGKPCPRRVKERIRCWQHRGQPAMLPDDKLVASHLSLAVQ